MGNMVSVWVLALGLVKEEVALSRNSEAFANNNVAYSRCFLDSSIRWNDGIGTP